MRHSGSAERATQQGLIFGASLACMSVPASATILTFDEPGSGPVGALSTSPYAQAGLTFSNPYSHGVWYSSPDQNAGDGTNVFENRYSDLTITAPYLCR
jgi:hypothetical protein